ncbi:Legumain [Triplophysa tibetana]|uniref:Legumain n=1 Tax=Triplophysa tibetana TaxID=1572043 RepID=A0A5A9N4A8_9TELE|nr:Legumain [Triplophysa tibetana]
MSTYGSYDEVTEIKPKIPKESCDPVQSDKMNNKQANVCCHYQLIKRQGIPPEQIVTMMYDDIASDPRNPQKGNILSVLDNENVYEGVLKDYTGKDVTPQNFLNALQGKCTDKKVINSCGNDNIYIYMTGLGTESTFKFPKQSDVKKHFLSEFLQK